MDAATILHIETATNVCSVALSKNGQLLSILDSDIRNSHSTILTTFIEDVLKNSGIRISEIDAVSVSAGPGSYTGLRIGVATAKGLCYSLAKPLISIPTLKAMAFGIWYQANSEQRTANSEFHICPMLDARRMEVYCSVYDRDLNEVRETRAEIIDENSFSDLLKDHVILFAGDGAEKCKVLFEQNENAVFLNDFKASAKDMITLAEEKYSNSIFEDLAYFEPFYLKDFIAGKPRVKGLD